ncbi:MAG: aryl-sulfate sulfotransferase [Isosphaeraceae bacterium]
MRLATKIILLAALGLAFLTAVARFISGLLAEPKAFPGYTLVAPVLSTRTHLVDMQGRAVRTWESKYAAGQAAYLLENGHLLRAAQLPAEERLFGGPQAGGRVQEFTWDGELVWDFKFHNDKQIPHHDLARLPGGNVLLIVWEVKTADETIAAGRARESVDGPWLVDSLIEIKPTGKTTGEVVWEWHVWDHLIQNRDSSGQNYGDVPAHPELIDVNFGQTLLDEVTHARGSRQEEARRKNQLKTLNSIGYLGAPAARGNPAVMPDWTHVNAVSYDADLDQILLTVRAFSEFWLIDHSTTSAEARGHAGGRSGMGGDLLYRWGNPQAYRAGTKLDERLFSPHDAHWIPRGVPGAGHVLVFNNGLGRPGSDYSSVDEIVLPLEAGGRYTRKPGAAFGPNKPVWSYTAPIATDFSVGLLSSAQRLPNGNTLICDGVSGTIFEVAPDRTVVWQQTLSSIVPSGEAEPGHLPDRQEPAARPQQILPPLLTETLKMSPDQKKDLDGFQHEVDAEIDRILDNGQKDRLRKMSGSEPEGSGGFAAPGQIMSLSRQVMLKPTDQQKKKLTELQKSVDDKLDQILTINQKTQFEKLKQDFGRGGRLGIGGGSVRGAARGPNGAGGPTAIAGPRPAGVNPIFRALRYGTDYPGLSGKNLRTPE